MRVLTQYLSDLPGRKDGEKAGNARTDCECGQLAFVQTGDLINRHVRLLGQGFDGSLMCGASTRMRGRGKPVHRSLS